MLSKTKREPHSNIRSKSLFILSIVHPSNSLYLTSVFLKMKLGQLHIIILSVAISET